MTQVIYGTELAAKIRESMKQEIADLVKRGERVPCLAVVLAGGAVELHVLYKRKGKGMSGNRYEIRHETAG